MRTRALTKARSLQNDTLQAAVMNVRAACLHQKAHPPVSKRLAAVLVPLFEDAEGTLKVVLCQRASNLSTHAGEISLPGGKKDETDEDDVHTATREAEEELGIKDVEVLGTMKPILSKHHLSVTPVVGKIGWPLTFQPNPAEVARIALKREPDFEFMPGEREYTDILYDDKADRTFWRHPTDEDPRL